jgi:hypothetical protein
MLPAKEELFAFLRDIIGLLLFNHNIFTAYTKEESMRFLSAVLTFILCLGLIAACGHQTNITQLSGINHPPESVQQHWSLPAECTKYDRGVLQSIYPVPYDEAWTGTLSALRQCQMTVVQTDRVVRGIINSKQPDGTPVWLRITAPRGAGETLISIQVGSGDEQSSRAINRAIADQLGLKKYIDYCTSK